MGRKVWRWILAGILILIALAVTALLAYQNFFL